jgi:hypothetical protein
MPGADETEVVAGMIESLHDDGAVLALEPPHGASRRLWIVPHEPGWGFHALWFSFIAVDVFEAGEADSGPGGEPVGRWFIRLGTP